LNFENSSYGKVTLFKGVAMMFENRQQANVLIESSRKQFSTLNDSIYIALTYMYQCNAASVDGDSLAFAEAYTRTLQFAKPVKEPFLLTTIFNNISISCFDFGRYAEAAELDFAILELIDKYPNPLMVSGKSFTYHNIAAIYMRLGDFKNGKFYAEEAVRAAKENHQNSSEMLGQLGYIYLVYEEDYPRALNIYKSISANEPNPQSFNAMAATTYALATCYRKLGDLQKAFPLAQKGVEILPIEKHASYGSAALVELAYCEFELGMLKEALQHGLLAYQTFSNAKNNLGGVESAALLTTIYKSMGDYSTALKFNMLRYEHQSQIERRQSIRQLTFGEYTREQAVKNARREAEVKSQLKRHRYIRYALFAGLAVFTFLAILLYSLFRLKQKSARQLEIKNKEIEAARSRAEFSEAFKSRFLANMSHEIRTPLHGISGFTELLLETPINEKQQRWLSSIHYSTDRLRDVVNDILDISKLEAGEVNLRQIPFSLMKLVSDVRDSLHLKAERNGTQLKVEIDQDIPDALVGDPTRLYQILMNLVGNAVKFTENGIVTLSIKATPLNTLPIASSRSLTPSHSVKFIISDTGIGIPPEKMATIFETFQQAEEDTTARFGGTGLGLTIARELIRLYHSDIYVESELGKGSMFSFVLTLPIADSSTLKDILIGGDSLQFDQPIRILLSDDNAFNREIAVEAIRRHFENAEVTEAVNGNEIVTHVGKRKFDLVLMDMQMPEMTGYRGSHLYPNSNVGREAKYSDHCPDRVYRTG
jgi:signal transduction histidine kinase